MTIQEVVAVAIEKARGVNAAARMLGVHGGSVSNWRTGESIPSFANAAGIARLAEMEALEVERAISEALKARALRRGQGPPSSSTIHSAAKFPLTKAGASPSTSRLFRALAPVSAV